ncbi:hypothetical protein [Rhodococcus pyridinivorans]|uniref:hypothetical protein n=1 Tax=Rhodococcus pyridinivorans TaxID=103816 RepID=UPI00265A7BFA|nr:hypothetical protein [Rhodococcus pyridinivorans]
MKTPETKRRNNAMNDSYAKEMRRGASEYRDVLAALTNHGYDPEFTQTGGMCFAIKLNLTGARYALVTDMNEVLAPNRSDHHGWTVSVYDSADDSEAIRYESTDDGTVPALIALTGTVLSGARTR